MLHAYSFIVYPGWTAFKAVICCDVVLFLSVHFTDDEGYIQSPNYAGHPYNLYPNNLNLTYTIEVDEDKHIMIEFDDLFHIEGDIGSCIDKLVISGGLEHGLSAHSNGM